MLTDLWDFRRQLEQQEILICFNGPLSQSIIEEIGAAVKKYLESENPGNPRLMDVFAVYIEQTQNIRNYARRKAAGTGKETPFDGITLLIAREGEDYLVASGNLVDKADLAHLLAALDEVRDLDTDGLKALYKERRRQARDESNPFSGAGLGIIDMARKTSRPLEYHVRELDNEQVFFNLIAVI